MGNIFSPYEPKAGDRIRVVHQRRDNAKVEHYAPVGSEWIVRLCDWNDRTQGEPHWEIRCILADGLIDIPSERWVDDDGPLVKAARIDVHWFAVEDVEFLERPSWET